jgi:hypothetical protein
MSQENDSQDKRTKDDKSFWKLILVSIGFFIALDLMRAWVGEPFATGLTILLIGLAFYWVPPRPNTNYAQWVVRISKWAILFFLARTAYETARRYFGM